MPRRKKGNPVHGWINLDKPAGLTSTQALGRVRRAINAQKAGHAGTLDPLATGVLPIALGEATKLIPFMQDREKEYAFEITFGEQRDTDDLEGAVIETSAHIPAAEDIAAALPRFTGTIEQIPPLYSAIKIEGQRAYDLARRGELPDIRPRNVHIEKLELLSSAGNKAMLKTTSGKGTYIRALARDLAVELGSRGYVSKLERTRVGPFCVENAISLEILQEMEHSAALEAHLLRPQTVLDDIPALALDTRQAGDLRQGRSVMLFDKDRLQDTQSRTAYAHANGQMIAIVEQTGCEIKPVRVLNL